MMADGTNPFYCTGIITSFFSNPTEDMHVAIYSSQLKSSQQSSRWWSSRGMSDRTDRVTVTGRASSYSMSLTVEEVLSVTCATIRKIHEKKLAWSTGYYTAFPTGAASHPLPWHVDASTLQHVSIKIYHMDTDCSLYASLLSYIQTASITHPSN